MLGLQIAIICFLHSTIVKMMAFFLFAASIETLAKNPGWTIPDYL